MLRPINEKGEYTVNTNPAYAVQQPYDPRKPYAAEQKKQFTTACLLGAAVLLYIIGNTVISLYLSADESRFYRYLHDNTFSLALGMVHTACNVFLPFVLVFLLIRRYDKMFDLPLGKAYDPYNAVLLTFIGLGGCYIANTITSYLTLFASSFGIESFAMQSMEDVIAENPAPAVMQILGYAVLPALFEEFAYRGVVLQSLRRYGDWFAILVSAFLFGMMHGNIVQIPFAFMVGIVLGYCTVVSGTMWVGVAIHFGNNLLSSLQGILENAYGESKAYVATASMMLCLFVLGVVCFIKYAKNNKNIFRLRPSRFPFMKHSAARVLCAPTVVIACAYFLYAAMADIVGFTEWVAESFRSFIALTII